jgi:Uma2 family endonuclease
MGMASPDAIYYTADMVRALNEANPKWFPRYECVYGELLVSPTPKNWHQLVVSRLVHWLMGYVERTPLDATVCMSPADISWGRDDVTVQPDVFVVPREMARASWRDESWTPVRHLLLAVEVLSPSSRRADRFAKRQLYQRQGVPLYCIVDPDARTVEVWTPDAHFPTIERERLVWHPEGAAEPFACALAELFAEP